MTAAEVTRLVAAVSGAWHVRLTKETMAMWVEQLLPVPLADAQAAYNGLLQAGGHFAPSLAEFMAAVAEVQQGPPPTAEEADEILRSNATRWPYRGHVSRQEHTEGAIRQLMGRGVHEAVCRFVAQVGGWQAAEMPDVVQGGLSKDAEIKRHELLKSYREHAVPAWRADPRPGLALAKVRGELTQGAQQPRRLRLTAPPEDE